MGGFGGGASMRERPADATTCLPLTDPSLQPRVASTQATKAVINRAIPDRRSTNRGSPITSPSSMPVVAMIEAAKISPEGVFRKRNTACWRPRSTRRPPTPPST